VPYSLLWERNMTMSEQEKIPEKYDFKQIEQKWQKQWERDRLYQAPEHPDPDNKFYMLVMFAYPSGDIHMGHFRNYVIGDAVARYQMMLGKDVLHPFGWDSFGLPAENAAIKHNVPPDEWTSKNIEISRSTLQDVGISFDWSREIASSSPDYYKWTQWIFLKLFEKGLAYRKRGFVNWCPHDKTVLANEQVVDGRCDRCDTLVEKKDQVQWYFKITDYADRLLDDLDTLDKWPHSVKTMQREWIGRSYGTEVDFTVEDTGEKLPVFTTRPDTIFGVTYMAIAPEAELLDRLDLEPEYAEKVAEYRKKAAMRSDIERGALTGDKDGVFTGKYAINPFNGEKVQLWVADYVLAGYGTGAVMAVPAHDTRDFAFAKKYDIPIRIVIHPDDNTQLNLAEMEDAFTDYGPMVNSGSFNGLASKEATKAVTEHALAEGFGRGKVNYKLKDWLISRQRYWGCPIPIVHCEKCGEVAIEETSLPVLLPKVDNYMPKGRSPLADVSEYMNVKCPKCGGEAQRDPDTMDTFVCSSWYYLRYIDSKNTKLPFDKEKVSAWMPVDLYVGGISHATGHLIYFRFFHKFLKDIGYITGDEPATQLFNHGMVQDAHGEVMSKSKGNVTSPGPLMEKHGVDVSRLAMFFTAPSEKAVLWNDSTITGVEKFLHNKLVPLVGGYKGSKPNLKQYFKDGELSDNERQVYVKLNQTIKRVTEDIERLQFNTAIAAVMELVRDYERIDISNSKLNDQIIIKTIQLMAPLTPHLSEELWSKLGYAKSVFKSRWPVYDPNAILAETIKIGVQINGKLRDTVEIPVDADQQTAETIVMASEKILSHLEGKMVIKKIYVKGRIFSIVIKI